MKKLATTLVLTAILGSAAVGHAYGPGYGYGHGHHHGDASGILAISATLLSLSALDEAHRHPYVHTIKQSEQNAIDIAFDEKTKPTTAFLDSKKFIEAQVETSIKNPSVEMPADMKEIIASKQVKVPFVMTNKEAAEAIMNINTELR